MSNELSKRKLGCQNRPFGMFPSRKEVEHWSEYCHVMEITCLTSLTPASLPSIGDGEKCKMRIIGAEISGIDDAQQPRAFQIAISVSSWLLPFSAGLVSAGLVEPFCATGSSPTAESLLSISAFNASKLCLSSFVKLPSAMVSAPPLAINATTAGGASDYQFRT
jgi:hypothetical protein